MSRPGHFPHSPNSTGLILIDRDRYILSKLNTLTADCNRFMENYSFGALANALHSFFIYEVISPSSNPSHTFQLCDVYLELIKPVVGFAAASQTATSDAEEKARLQVKRLAQMTLYTCLEQYLRLTHPLMPFVTEELWQRLPNRESLNPTASIMLCEYPTTVPAWFAPEQEEDMTVITSMIHAARSRSLPPQISFSPALSALTIALPTTSSLPTFIALPHLRSSAHSKTKRWISAL